MKKTITCLLLTTGLTGYLSAQTPFRDKSDKNEGKVIHMDKQMFLDNIFDYTSGSTEYKGLRVPTLMIFKNGKQLWRQSGVMRANDLSTILAQYE